MTEGKPSFGEYHRQGMACLFLARLSDVPDVQARWLMMSQTWFKLAQNADAVHAHLSNVLEHSSGVWRCGSHACFT